MRFGEYPNFDRPLTDFDSTADWLVACRAHFERQFDVDPVEFEAQFGVSVEHAAQYNDSWTGQHGFHACTSQPCIDSIDELFGGVKGWVCWCDCHKWNKR